jgi:uncharacterized protein
MVQLGKDEIVKMRIKRIEKEIRDTPYHKATEHHIGRLRAKLANLKDGLLTASAKKGGGVGYAVKKQGDATVTLVGSPSVGKSTLLNKLTNANSKIAPYSFTTVTVIPGMMKYKDAKIQILDVPGLIEGAEIGKGRGKEVLSVVRGSDLLLIMCDVENMHTLNSIAQVLEKSGIRINKEPPQVSIVKKLKGGVQIHTNIPQNITKQTIADTAKEFGLTNAEITIKEKLNTETLIDSFSKNRIYIKAINVINKIDTSQEPTEHESINAVPISAENNINIDELKEKIWQTIGFYRVYLVKKGENPTTSNPLVLRGEKTLKEIAKTIGEEFSDTLKGVKIWGTGAKFEGQEVSLSSKAEDGMFVNFY